MTLTEDDLSCSRRQRIKEFKAAFDAEYAGSEGAATKARFEVVLR